MPTSNTNRTRTIWRSRLGSALRTALACTIVGCITLFGPISLQHLLAFPALSYVTVIMIVSEATLGDALRGCWYATSGTFQGVIPAIFSLWLIGPARFSITTIVLAVTISTFVVSLPLSTHMISKRIALAQIVIVYSVTSAHGVHTGVLMHPVHVAVSTIIGAVASLVALVIPYPRFSCYEVKDKYKLFKENASARLNHYVNALCAEDNSSALASLSQAKALIKTGTTLLQNIQLKQESIQWEKPHYRWTQSHSNTPVNRLQAVEIPLRGMEIALTPTPSSPVIVTDEELRNLFLSLKENISVTLKQSKFSPSKDSATAPQTKGDVFGNSFHIFQAILRTRHDLPSLFSLFCMKLIHHELTTDQSIEKTKKDHRTPKVEEPLNSKCTRKWFLGGWDVNTSTERLILALKCSFSLGLSVLFGMMFNKENGYWSGLTVAVGMAFGREATFKVANLKAQGMVLGSIYGVLSCFVFQRFIEIRFISLLPFILFTSFLRRSRMYGQVGAAPAVIGALIMLGRKNFGGPSSFAIVRITEGFIGLGCSLLVELLFQPTRASTLAKIQLPQTLRTLYEYVGSVSFHVSHGNKMSMCLSESKENEKRLKAHVNKLGKFVGEADAEPNFWFLPFQSVCYAKLLRSLSKMAELLHFTNHAIGFLIKESNRFGGAWNELQKNLDNDLDHFKKMVRSSIKCLEEVTSIKSLPALEEELKARGITYDLELGNSPNANVFKSSPTDGDEMEKIISSFVQHSKEVVEKIQGIEGDEELKGQLVLCLSAVGFCIGGLMKETKDLETTFKELVQWENPSSNINLYEIHCKIKALYT